MKHGFLFVISGPSAVGKSTIADEILKIDRSIGKIVTCTTRKIRSTEIDGIDYNFMNKEDFFLYKSRGDFVESSEVYGNYYGVLLSSITKKVENENDSLLVINWEGFLKIKKAIGKNVVGFFLTPPSIEALEERIKSRATDSEEVILQRLKMANEDMRHRFEYDFCVENSDIKKTTDDILCKMQEARGNANK
jgi:guanylate kinase